MIELVKEQAALIQERLWEIATSCYGLDRTPETVARIDYTFIENINQECQKSGSPHLVQDVVQKPIDAGLANAFMSASLAESETDLSDAVAMLTVAAEALGMIGIIGHLNYLGLKGPIDLEKAGLLGESLLRGVLAKGHASALAKMRHAENYSLAEEALKFWREKISPNLSAQKAATELEKVVPLSHKKLAELVSAEKKKVFRVRKLELVRKP